MGTEQAGSLSIVIVNWNSGEMLRRCLESMADSAELRRVARVVVVDNNSHDLSCHDLPSLPVPVTLIRNDSNRGFAAACNQGADACPADYLLFLNPDSLLQPGSLSAPLEFLDAREHQDVGICGIQLVDENGRVARSCSRLPTFFSLMTLALRLSGLSKRLFPPHFMKEWDHAETRVVDQVIGAFFLVRNSLFQQLGGFDERFFVYFEEVDFCERTRQQGLKTVYLATAQAVHIGAGCSSQIKGRSLFYSLRSRIQYAQKHLPRRKAMLVAMATLMAEPTIRLARAFLKLKWKTLGPLFYAFGSLWRDRVTQRPLTGLKWTQTVVHFPGSLTPSRRDAA